MGYVSPTWPWFLGVSENGLPQKKAMLQWDSKKRNDYQPSNLGGTLFWDQPVYVYIYRGNHPQFMALNLEIYEMNDPDSQNMFKKSCNPNSPNL